MKTTMLIPDSLFEEAKRLAQRDGTTMTALVEEALRRVISERRHAAGTGFRLRDASFGGVGLQPEIAGASWEELRRLSYGDRGG